MEIHQSFDAGKWFTLFEKCSSNVFLCQNVRNFQKFPCKSLQEFIILTYSNDRKRYFYGQVFSLISLLDDFGQGLFLFLH